MTALARLWRLAGRDRWWVGASAAATSVTLCAGIGLAAASAELVSRAALTGTTTTLALAITWVRLFAVLRAAGRYVERYVGHLGTFRILTRLRVQTFRALLPLSPGQLRERRRGDVLAGVVDDVDTVGDLALRVAVPPVAATVATLVASILVGAYDARLGLALAGFLVLCGVVLPLAVRRLSRSAAAAAVDLRGARHGLVAEAVAGRAEFVAAGASEEVADAVEALERRLHAQQERLARSRAAASALAALVAGAAAVVLLASGVVLVTDGGLAGVHLALLPLTALAAFEAVAPLGLAVEHLDRGRAAGARLVDLGERPPAVPSPAQPAPAPAGASLEVAGLTVRYDPDGPAVLDDVHVEVPEGSVVAVVGPSGSGKSTLVAVLQRFVDDGGAVRLGGTPLAALDPAVVRDRVAVVAQHDHLFDTSVRDNLALADPTADDTRLLAALDDAGLADVVRALPDGLDHRIGADGSRLSGGERQRLLVARGLLCDAPVLVLDEATAHLDAPTARRLLTTVLRRRTGRTTVVVAHHADLDDVDLVLRLDRGVATVERPVRS